MIALAALWVTRSAADQTEANASVTMTSFAAPAITAVIDSVTGTDRNFKPSGRFPATQTSTSPASTIASATRSAITEATASSCGSGSSVATNWSSFWIVVLTHETLTDATRATTASTTSTPTTILRHRGFVGEWGLGLLGLLCRDLLLEFGILSLDGCHGLGIHKGNICRFDRCLVSSDLNYIGFNVHSIRNDSTVSGFVG